MNLKKHDEQQFDEFLSAIDPLIAGYKHINFAYVAIKSADKFSLMQGRLVLQVVPLIVKIGKFESETIKVGNYSLENTKESLMFFFESLLSGELDTPHGALHFPIDPNQSSYSVYFDPLHMEGIQTQRRQARLRISGGSRPHFNASKVDWELKANAEPFDNLQEICGEFGIGAFNAQQSVVEIIAYGVAAIDSRSVVQGARANLAIILADGLSTEKATIGYRIFEKNRIVSRGHIIGSEIKWEKEEGVQKGTCSLDVSPRCVVHCIANYAGQAHQFYWVHDPSTVQNARRAIHQAFDEKMEILTDLLKIQGKRDARDFEHVIAWLLWMLGFNVSHNVSSLSFQLWGAALFRASGTVRGKRYMQGGGTIRPLASFVPRSLFASSFGHGRPRLPHTMSQTISPSTRSLSATIGGPAREDSRPTKGGLREGT